MSLVNLLVILAFVSSALAFAGEFVPKSFYIIDKNGHKSDVVYIRNKRDIELIPLRLKRGGGSSSASSHASASASSSSSSGGGGDPYYGGNGYNPGFASPDGFNQGFFGTGGGGAQSSSFASASSGSSSGSPGSGYGGHGGVGNPGYNGPILFSRFGEDTGTGVQVSGNAKGEKGAFSSSSATNDNGKITYSVQSGKY